jgi:hypothetical protein
MCLSSPNFPMTSLPQPFPWPSRREAPSLAFTPSRFFPWRKLATSNPTPLHHVNRRVPSPLSPPPPAANLWSAEAQLPLLRRTPIRPNVPSVPAITKRRCHPEAIRQGPVLGLRWFSPEIAEGPQLRAQRRNSHHNHDLSPVRLSLPFCKPGSRKAPGSARVSAAANAVPSNSIWPGADPRR